MKYIVLSLLIFFLATTTFCQVTPATANTKEYYLQKSKNQKTTGWILLAGGTTMAIIGGIGIGQSDFWSTDNESFDAAGFLFAGGIVADLVSIPFFISSSKNARKAATIGFNHQKILWLQPNGIVAKAQPSIHLRIRL